MTNLIRVVRAYAGIAAMVPKLYLAYTTWVWLEMIVQLLSVIIFSYFWRAVYASDNAASIGGLTLTQTLNYILLARILAPLVETRLIFQFGFMVRSGQVAVELIRPIDPQLRFYVEQMMGLGIFFVQRLPLFLIVWLVFGLQLPAEPLAWVAFGISLVLGQTVLFLFDWLFACLAFYSTETWGLSVVRVGAAMFFSGSLVPLNMMPAWLQTIANALPFAQALAVPVSFFSGVTPASAAPQVWLIQLLWIVALWVISRLMFQQALKTITVQGG